MPPGSAPEVVGGQGTKGAFHIVRHGLERDLAEKRACPLFSLGSGVGMSGKKTVANARGFVGFESFENRGRDLSIR